jgi:hypothetical protein
MVKKASIKLMPKKAEEENRKKNEKKKLDKLNRVESMASNQTLLVTEGSDIEERESEAPVTEENNKTFSFHSNRNNKNALETFH